MIEKITHLRSLATKLGWSEEELLSEAVESGFLDSEDQTLGDLGLEKAQAFIEHLTEYVPTTEEEDDDEDDDDYEEEDDED